MTAPMDGRLGRRFAGHDERSRAFGVRAALPPRVVRKPTFWPMPGRGFPLDQRREGGCEAWGLAHELAAGPVVIPGITNTWAHRYYRQVQTTDRAMGNDFGDGATTLANMKTAAADKLISGYRWCFGPDDVVDTVVSSGPVCLGVEWREGMYSTSDEGRVKLLGEVVGGHFITVLGYDVHPHWGPSVLWLNSWGRNYGVPDRRLGVPAGVGWLTLPALATLLAADGEAVVPADFLTVPARLGRP